MNERRLLKENNAVSIINNKSHIFFLPMLGEFIGEFRNLRGVFIWNDDFPDFDDHIFLLFKNSYAQEFIENLNRLKAFSNFIFSYEPDNFHTMLVFFPPDYYIEDYNNLKKSKYSEVSDIYKKHIFKFFNIKQYKDFEQLRGVLYKKDQYKKVVEQKYDIEIPEGQELASALRKYSITIKGQEIVGECYTEDMKVLTTEDNSNLLG